VKNAECVAKMEAVQECTSDAYEIMDEALENDDGRKDFEERKYCNYMTTSYENCTDVLRDCFPQEEINFWIDNDLSNYMDGIEEFYGNWDSQKCPPFRKMLERKANDQSTSSECRTAMESFHDCRQKALVEWEESEDDGRPDFSERKRCNFETGWLATCPSKLLDVCKSKDEIERMQFWELFTDKFEYENWDMDKCPAVKEVTSRWNDLKKSFEDDSSEDESDEGVPTCEDLKSQLLSVRTEGCLQYSCSTGSMKVEMLEKCKELINAEVQKIVKKRLEECKG